MHDDAGVRFEHNCLHYVQCIERVAGALHTTAIPMYFSAQCIDNLQVANFIDNVVTELHTQTFTKGQCALLGHTEAA